MNDANGNDRLFIARLALVLFVGGLLGPIVIATAWGKSDAAALTTAGLALIAEVLALFLGIVGRKHLAGRIGMFGAAVVLGLALLSAAVALLRWAR
jgi:hypothetical protein